MCMVLPLKAAFHPQTRCTAPDIRKGRTMQNLRVLHRPAAVANTKDSVRDWYFRPWIPFVEGVSKELI